MLDPITTLRARLRLRFCLLLTVAMSIALLAPRYAGALVILATVALTIVCIAGAVVRWWEERR